MFDMDIDLGSGGDAEFGEDEFAEWQAFWQALCPEDARGTA